MRMPNNINEKLANVPKDKRVFIYDASIIIEFLSSTFMPLRYHLKPQEIHTVGAGNLGKKHMKESEKYEELFLSVGKLYDYYLIFREYKPYTSPIESRYKFSLIIKKLLFPKNGWQFEVKRIGRAQIIYAGPCKFRSEVEEDILKMYPITKARIESIDVTLSDLQMDLGEDSPNEPSPVV